VRDGRTTRRPPITAQESRGNSPVSALKAKRRLWPLVVALGLAAAACGGGSEPRGGATPAAGAVTSRPTPVELPQAPTSPRESVPAALEDPDASGLPAPLVDADRLISGGPPPDGIPAVDRPKFLRPSQVGFLEPAEPVLAVEVAGEARAYPVQILIWHEIVNDTVGGVPIAVTYCPLCNSALAFDRRAAGRVLDFGTSGLLYNSDLVMYDRQTRSLWPQIEGRAVAGVLTGTELSTYLVSTVTWREWRSTHPDDWVLSRDTGHPRDYGRNPYVGYDQANTDPFLFDGVADPRLPPKTRVITLRAGDDAVAVTLDRVAADRVLEVSLDDRPIVLFAQPGLASALDGRDIAAGKRVAATGAFEPALDGRRLTFRADGDRIIDVQTGSQWSVLGEPTEGPLRGRRLKAVQHVDTFWFAWAAFQPDTRLIQ
jgi:Protein of unknown function (DUF3179)